MAITITIEDSLAVRLQDRAKRQRLSVQQLVTRILTEAAAGSVAPPPREVVAQIQATPANAPQIRASTTSLADLLRDGPDDPSFDLENWKRQWSAIEAELRIVTRANDLTEGRAG